MEKEFSSTKEEFSASMHADMLDLEEEGAEFRVYCVLCEMYRYGTPIEKACELFKSSVQEVEQYKEQVERIYDLKNRDWTKK